MKPTPLFKAVNTGSFIRRIFNTLVFTAFVSLSYAQTPLGTTKVFGSIDGVSIAGKVQSPSGQATPLQVVCLFEYTEGDLTSPTALPENLNGMVHVDKALRGLITDLRKSGKFAGHAYETLLITPAPGTIPAKKLLLIGLGDRTKFSADLMTDIGRIGMREALRLGVDSYSHASDLKDAGIDSPTGPVAQNVVKGAMEAYETDLYLHQKGMAPAPKVKKVTLLAGPAFFTVSGEAIEAYIKSRK
ncbi:peptidase M17 [Mucilaginibacter sp. RS28]|uniref:Peptidase M17 n=1 Tax=Mucilaginibacter straminoryzae TaxID=2932774 RepID=A0A9X1X0Y6_9SPHI|nr:M17 family peptidase N-terminal domain-containing protein [Mucilaginibacter straminoryzae]MCJ8208370.1 peptidase M17 [Mucilaginibacter straminoryzae]